MKWRVSHFLSCEAAIRFSHRSENYESPLSGLFIKSNYLQKTTEEKSVTY